MKMADKDNYEKAVDSIEEQIRKLVEEKEDLERRTREKQQQERLRLLKENVSTLRTGSGLGAGASPSNRRSLGSRRDDNRDDDLSFDLTASLAESQARIRAMQQNILSSTKEGTSGMLDDSREEVQRFSDDAEDDVMSPEHKQALRMNRDVLVENMTPDDIFNDLISKHVLTSADVSRIKDRNTTEAVNEELLNVLIRRSDRAFHVFVASLRRTLQGWLANRIDPVDPDHYQRNKRKRKTGEVDVNLNCERIVPASKRRHTCTCHEVEEQILAMAKGAFAHIRRRDGSSASFEQFKKELKQTNEVIMETMETVNTLKILCRHGEIIDMTEGSVCFSICCSSLASCLALWDAYESGVLLQAFQKGLVTPSLLHLCNARDIKLCLKISRQQYLTCALELARRERQSLLIRQCKSASHKTAMQVKRTACIVQNENLPRGLTKRSFSRKGQAFQEIPINALPPTYHACASRVAKEYDKPVAKTKLDRDFFSGHATRLCSFVQELSMRGDVELRCYGKDVPFSHRFAPDQKLAGGCLSGSCKFGSQISRGCKQNALKTRQSDACPYNLRYRQINYTVHSI